MNKKSIFSVVILFLILSITVGFSAFSSEMSIGKIAADVRVKKDIRITGIGITGGSTTGSYSELNWDTDSVMLGDLINGKGDYVNLEVTVTNFESAEMGIYDIIVPDGIDFEISNYNMESKICNTSGKCNLGISKVLNLKVSNSSYSDVNKSIKVDFDFREMHKITYEGITNNSYPTEIISGSNLNVDFTGDIPENLIIYKDGTKVDSSKYTYSNNTLSFSNVSGDLTIKSAKNLFNIIKLKTNGVDTNIDFGVASSETNGDGVNTIDGTENDQYPVYYYRGNVTDNNVKFANFCWKMVRTTDTGGVKLIYNGVPGDDGSCNNTGTASQIGTSYFNSQYSSPADVGYMYGTIYDAVEKNMTNQTESYIFGNDVEWDGTYYKLINTKESSNWSTDRTTLLSKYHYTCFNNTGICQEVYYLTSLKSADNLYYLTLNNGNNLEKVMEAMFSNVNDSLVKKENDNWYKNNMVNYTHMLEDTIWCNDRTIVSGTLNSKDDTSVESVYFSSYWRNRRSLEPSLVCTEKRDSFTVDENNGNGSLNYPIGLLTADEYTLAGSGNDGYSISAYLYTGETQWSMSPSHYDRNNACLLAVNSKINYYVTMYSYGIRPAISLKVGTLITGGDGSASTPYIVE